MSKNRLTAHTFSCMRGNKKIVGKYFLPKTCQGGKLPVAIVSHGFLVNMSTTRSYAEQLADWGYASFIFDFCGGGFGTKSDGPTTEMTVLTEMEDLEAVIRFAQQQEFADADNLTLMGCSQGGFVSAMVAAKLKSQVSALVLFYPALCIPDGAREGALMFAHFDPQNIPAEMKCGPITIGHDYPACLLEVDALEAIDGYSGPVCILHGDSDQVVNVDYSRRAYEQYLGGNCPSSRVRLHILSGAGHGFNGETDRTAMRLVREFLNGSTPFLCVDVELTDRRKTWKPGELHVSLPFTGKAAGPYFNGTIEDGASDEQSYRLGRAKRSCVAYTISGEDYTGRHCTMQITNRFDGKNWTPEIHTDSEALAFVNQSPCSCVFEKRKRGPVVRLFCQQNDKIF